MSREGDQNDDGIGGVRILVKEELCKGAIEVRTKSDRVTSMVLVFEKQVIRVCMCVWSDGAKMRQREKSIL